MKCTPTSSESLEKEEDINRLEVASKHIERSDVGKSNAQRMAKFERCLEAMESRGKLHNAGHDRPIQQHETQSSTPSDSRFLCYIT